jgi:hypothetical protein
VIRRLARQLAPRALLRLAQLAESDDPSVAQAAALALLDRGYGLPVTADLVEESIAREHDLKRSKADRLVADARHAMKEDLERRVRALLQSRFDALSPEERKEQVLRLRDQVAEWESRERWIETHVEHAALEDLALGATCWTHGNMGTGTQ